MVRQALKRNGVFCSVASLSAHHVDRVDWSAEEQADHGSKTRACWPCGANGLVREIRRKKVTRVSDVGGRIGQDVTGGGASHPLTVNVRVLPNSNPLKNWRTRQDSNLWPLPSERDFLCFPEISSDRQTIPK